MMVLVLGVVAIRGQGASLLQTVFQTNLNIGDRVARLLPRLDAQGRHCRRVEQQ